MGGKKIMTAYPVTRFLFSGFLTFPISCKPNTNAQQGVQPL